MVSCRVLNCDYFGTKSKVIGHVEEELWFFLTIFKIDGAIFYEFSKFDVKYLEDYSKWRSTKKLGLLFVLWRMRVLNIRQVICKIASRWDLKSEDFSNLHFVGQLGQKIKYLQNHNFGTTQVINIKLVSLKSDKKKIYANI